VLRSLYWYVAKSLIVHAFCNSSPRPLQQANHKVCETFHVRGYPSIVLGSAQDVLARSAPFISGRTVETLVNEVALRTHV
jgi:hypothetical protein